MAMMLIDLVAFGWTELLRSKLAFAERYHAVAAELLRAAHGDPRSTSSNEADFAEWSLSNTSHRLAVLVRVCEPVLLA
jgi:hypothetical protein